MYKMIGADGQPYGPVSTDQIRRWITEGRAAGHTLLQAEGSTEWKPLSQFPEFANDVKAPPPPSPPMVTPTTAGPPNPALAAKASNKIVAGICGILLGSFGIHKFILGYTGAGVIMLLVTLLSCFLASPIMGVIGVIEGILYLTKSDEEFVRTYIDGRKEWF